MIIFSSSEFISLVKFHFQVPVASKEILEEDQMDHGLKDARQTSEFLGITLTTVYFQVYLLKVETSSCKFCCSDCVSF